MQTKIQANKITHKFSDFLSSDQIKQNLLLLLVK